MKTKMRRTIRNKQSINDVLIAVFVILANLLYANIAFALPSDYEVVSGTAEFKAQDNTLTINASNNAIVNYKSFDIAANEKVIVNLPDASSQILNRVNSNLPTTIAGTLICDRGLIILVNEAGIYIARDAMIRADKAILSTRDITNNHFLTGNYLFEKISKDKVDRLLLNEGTINIINGGFGVLIAGAIENKGVITAEAGTIALAGGDAVTITFSGNQFLSVAITKPVAGTILDYQGRPVTEQIKNTGTLSAKGGTIILAAESVNDIFTKAINLEGVVSADRVEEKNGTIRIVSDGVVSVGGSVAAATIIIGRTPETVTSIADIQGMNGVPTTVIIEKTADLKASEFINITSKDLVRIDSAIEAPTVTLVSGGAIDTTGAAIIQGTTINLTAPRLGTSQTPVQIQADNIYIKKLNGDIDIRQSIGIGTSVQITGPPASDSINILYNKSCSQLTLKGNNIIISGDSPTYFYGNITFSSLSCTIPGKEIYFEAGKTYTILGTMHLEGTVAADGSINSIHLFSSEKGVRWHIDPQGTEEVSGVYVQDSYNIDSRLICGPNIDHDGNSYNWDAPRYSVANGNWNSTSTWSATSGGAAGASVPVAGDTVTIEGGHNVTVTVDATCTSITFTTTTATSLTINPGVTLTVSGAITIPRSGAGVNLIAVGAGILNAGSIAFTNGGGNMRHEITISTGTVTVTGNVTQTGSTGSATIAFTDAGLLRLGGTFLTSATGTLIPGTGTVEYNAALAQMVGDFTYNNLTLSNSGTKTTTGVTINGVLSMEGTATASTAPTYGAAATLQYNTATARTAGPEWITPFAATGGVIIANTGTITMNSAEVLNTSVPLTINNGATLATNNYQLTFGGDFVNNGGTFTAGSSPIVITGTMAAQSIAGFTTTGTVSILNNNNSSIVTFTGSVNGGALTVNGGNGTLDLGAGLTHTFTGAWTWSHGTINGDSSTLNIGGAVNYSNGLTFTPGTSTVNYNGTGAQTIANVNYNNLGFSGARTTNSITINGAVGIAGTLTNTATFSSGNFVLTGSTITFNGSGAQTIPSLNGVSYVNLVLSGGGSTTLGAAIAVTTAFSISSGDTFDPSSYILSGAGTFTVSGTAIVPGATFAANYTIAGTKTINAGSTFNYTNANPTINAGITYQNLQFSGTGTASASGALTIQGNLTNTGGGILNFGANNVTFNGNAVTQNIVGFTTTGTVSILNNNNSSIVTFTGSVNGGALTVNGGNGTLDLGAGLTHTFTGAWTWSHGTINGDSSTLNIGGAVNYSNGLTFTPGTSTVNYNGTGAQTIAGVTYNNLTLSGSGVKTTTGVTVNGILSMEGTATASAAPTYGAAATLQYNTATARTAGVEWITPFVATGGVIIANTGTITMNSAEVLNTSVPLTINNGATLATNNYQLTFGGDFVNNGTLIAGSSAIILSGTGNQDIGGFTTLGSVTMAKTGGIATMIGNMTCASLTINGTGGTLDLGTGLTHYIGGDSVGAVTFTNGTLDGGSSILNITGNFTGNGGTFTASTGTVNFNGNAATAQTINRNAAIVFYNLMISGNNLAGAGVTLNHYGGGTTVNGTLTLASGTFTLTTGLTLGNGATIVRDTGILSAAPTFGTTVNVTYIGNGSYSISNDITNKAYEIPAGATVLNNLTVNKSGGAVTLAKNITVNGNLTVSSGVLDLSTFTANRSSAGGTLTVSDGGTLKIGGTNTIPSNYSTHSIDAAGTIEYSGTNQSVAMLNSSQNYGNLTISGSGTKTLAGITTVNGNLTIGTGATLDVSTNNYAITVGGNWSNSGTFTQRSGTVTFNGSNTSYISGTTTTIFSTLIMNKTNSDVVLYSGIAATTALNINAGNTLTLAGNSLNLTSATFTNSGTLRLIGSETLTGFTNDTAHSGTVEYYGNGTYGSLVAGLSYCNLTFSGNGTYTMTGSVTVTGNVTFSSPYSYYKTITIDYTKVGMAVTDFPMLFSVTDPDLRTLANGGYVTNANGYDIIFTDANGVKLAYQVELYAPATGQFIAWVKVPSISNTKDTLLYIYYGNSTVTASQENIPAVWSNYYEAVYHMAGNAADSTANAFNGTIAGATATTGKIDGAEATGVNQYITDINMGEAGVIDWTESAWVKTTSTAAGVVIDNRAVFSDRTLQLHVGWWAGSATNNGYAYFSIDTSGAEYGAVGTTNIADGNWHYITGVRSTVAGTTSYYIYVDGLLQGSNNMTIGAIIPAVSANSTQPWQIADHGAWSTNFNGSVDEVNIANMGRPAGWILTAYNNQANPTKTVPYSVADPAFYTLGSPVKITPTLNAGSNSMSVAGNWINNGTFNAGTGTVTFNGTTTISGSSTNSFNNVTISGTLTSPAANINVAGNWVNNGTFNPDSGTITFNGTTTISGSSTNSFNNVGITGTLTAPNANMNVAGNWINNGTFNAGTGTITFNGTTTISGSSTNSFNNVGITGTLTAPNANMNVAGDWDNNGTFNAGTGTVTFNGGNATITTGGTGAGKAFYNVIINSTGAKTLGGAMMINKDMQVNAGTFDGNYDVTVKGGNVTGNGTINMNDGTFTVQGTGSFGGSGGNWTLNDLIFGDGTSTATTTKNGTNAINVSDVLSVNSNHTLMAGATDWNLSWASYLKLIKSISAGYDHTVALTEDGYVFAWGCNFMGQIGNNSLVDSLVPIQVLSGAQGGGTYLHNITQISAGGYHNLVLADDGSVYSWGYNANGQLGNGTTVDSLTPVKVLSGAQSGGSYLHNISQVSGGGMSSAVVVSDGSVYSWGYNGDGELGNGTLVDSSSPVRVLSGAQGGGTYLHNISQVTVGGIQMIALGQNNFVYSWGYNGDGELGDGTLINSSRPIQVLSGAQGGGTYLHNIIKISSGDAHSIVLASDGSVYTWGCNDYGELGDGTFIDRSSPVRVLSGEQGGGTYIQSITDIAAGASHNLVIAQDGSLYSWGDNRFGQLGNGTYVNNPAPIKVLSGAQGGGTYLHNISLVAAGGAQTVALTQTSPVFSAGCNANGQLGNGTTIGAVAQIKVLAGSQAGPAISHIPLVVSGTLNSQTSTFNIADIYHQIVYVTSATYYNLNLNDNLRMTFILNGNIVVQNSVVLNNADLMATSYNMTVGGNWTNSGGAFTAGTGTVTFNGTAQQSVALGGSAFNTVTVKNTSAAGVSFTDRLVTNTLNAKGSDGVKKISFATASAAAPNTISTTFNVDGLNGSNLLELAPVTANSVWYLDAPTGSHSFLKVGYSHEANGKTLTAISSSNQGNNTNWNITP